MNTKYSLYLIISYFKNLHKFIKDCSSFQDSLKLKPSAPISEARHEKKIHTPVRFSIEKISFGLEDVFEWMKALIESLAIEIVSQEKTSEEFVIEFRS